MSSFYTPLPVGQAPASLFGFEHAHSRTWLLTQVAARQRASFVVARQTVKEPVCLAFLSGGERCYAVLLKTPEADPKVLIAGLTEKEAHTRAAALAEPAAATGCHLWN